VLSDGRGEPLVYVSGDTVWIEGTQKVARRFPVKVAILFAGAAQVRGPFNLTMSTNDVLEAAHYFCGAAIVPVHYHGWKRFTQNHQDLAKAFAALGLSDRLHIVLPGAQVTLPL
jgi:L-ascorbate metabolism protein UlaG (beta-lactamase superfamily)